MSPAVASQTQQTYGLLFVVTALCWLWISFADGPIFLLMSSTGMSGYLLYIAPVAALLILTLIVFKGARLTGRVAIQQGLILVGFGAIAIVQRIHSGSFDVTGYVQLYATFALCFLISGIYQDNAGKLGTQFANSMLWIHYFLCLYCVLAWLGVNVLDINIEIRDTANSGGSLFGFLRTSGFHRESAWAGQAMAATFLICYYLRPDQMLPVTFVYVFGILASGSATGLMLAVVFTAYLFVARKNIGLGVKILVSVLALGAFLFVFRERIQDIFNGVDPSTSMRLASTRPAFDIIREQFPFGTGYGNFRDYAVYDLGFSQAYINLDSASSYKSDLAIMNIVAELSVMGIAILFFFAKNFYVRATFLIVGYVVFGYFSSGSLVAPPYFALAALAGLMRALELRNGSAMAGLQRPLRRPHPVASYAHTNRA